MLTGVISYNLTNASYAKWSSSTESKNIIKLSIKSEMNAISFARKKVGTNGLELVTHEIDNTLQVNEKFATEYRYRGGDSVVKNYVTFNNETWRIIGIIPTEDTDGNVEYRFKIIRNESIDTKYWNECEPNGNGYYCIGIIKYFNNWTTATLNEYLNSDYYNALNNDAKNMIGTTKYYLGGYSDSNITSDTMWQYERKKVNGTDCTIEVSANTIKQIGTQCYYFRDNEIMQSDANKKIVLMYASDYGYGASKECTSNLGNYNSANCKTTNNWLDRSLDEWLLSPDSITYGEALIVQNSEVFSDVVNINEFATRPTLTLSSKVQISGGEGTSDSQYQLTLTQ